MSASSVTKKKEIFDKNILKKLNFNIKKINGHNIKNILSVLKKFKKSKKSTIIIANTIKGKGFKIFENNIKYNHEFPAKEILERIIKENYA